MSKNPVPARVVQEPNDIPSDRAPSAITPDAVIIARPDFWYRSKRYLMAIALVGLGPWFAYDGWKGWPAENQKIADLNAELDHANKVHDDAKRDELNKNPLTHTVPHSNIALNIQKMLAGLLPVLGVFTGFWTMRASRGVYRLNGDVLDVPGHPSVKLRDVVEIDRSRWDRKGIAVIYYAQADGKKGKMTIDDFVYEREPTDKIFERLEGVLKGQLE